MQKVIERALNLLAFLLTAQRPVTADEIRSTVAGYDQPSDEAFRRTFERDKDLLRRLGVPLEMRPTDAWEVEFGYVVPNEAYSLDDPGLTDEERTALLLAAQAVRFGGQPAGPDAVLKLGGTPMVTGGEPLGAELGDSEGLPAAFAAVSERRTISFTYRGSGRVVLPYGLVHRRGHWYLVGPERTDPATVKAFRLDRARDVVAGPEVGVFEKPEGFRAAEAVPEAPWDAGEPRLTATVAFDADVAWIAERELSGRISIDRSEDGSIVVDIPVSVVGPFLGWLVGFEDGAVVLAPAELREAMRELIESSA